MTDNANIFQNGAVVASNVPFVRLPAHGELISHGGQWFAVEAVYHDITGGFPVAVVMVNSMPAAAAVGFLPAGPDPFLQ